MRAFPGFCVTNDAKSKISIIAKIKMKRQSVYMCVRESYTAEEKLRNELKHNV